MSKRDVEAGCATGCVALVTALDAVRQPTTNAIVQQRRKRCLKTNLLPDM